MRLKPPLPMQTKKPYTSAKKLRNLTPETNVKTLPNRGNMDNVIRTNTYNFRASIADFCGISKQGFASKADADPIRFLILIFEALVTIRRKKQAQIIWADICARVETVFNPIRRYTLVEIVRLTQVVFSLEVDDSANRHDLLQAWRELSLAARSRISELTLTLEPTGFGG